MELKPDKLQSVLEEHGFEVKERLGEDRVKPSLNVAPQSYNLIFSQDPKTKQTSLKAMKWTLQPSYAKEPVSFPSFNTRSESLDPLKPAWKCATQRRGILFMQGYYEWNQKRPYYIFSSEVPLLCCLVIWDVNTKLCEFPTFSIVTTAADASLRHIHERMPVLTSFKVARDWVHGSWPNVLEYLQPNSKLQNYEVSKDVNKVGTNRPGLNKPVTEAKVTEWFKPSSTKRKPKSTHPPTKSSKIVKNNSNDSKDLETPENA